MHVPADSACFFHQIATCGKHMHNGHCLHEAAAVFAIDDAKAQLQHLPTIAVWQLITPNNLGLSHAMIECFGDAEHKTLQQYEVGAKKFERYLKCRFHDKEPASGGFCSSCSAALCSVCAKNHTRKTCKILELCALGQAWTVLLKERLFAQCKSFEEILSHVPLGNPVRTAIKCKSQREFQKLLADECHLISHFAIGCDWAKKKLAPAPPPRVPKVSSFLAPADVQKQQAIQLLTQWEYAEPSMRRRLYRSCNSFLKGEETLDDLEKSIPGSDKKTKKAIPDDAGELDQREYLTLCKFFENDAAGWSKRCVFLNGCLHHG